jgi:hypothetical protein
MDGDVMIEQTYIDVLEGEFKHWRELGRRGHRHIDERFSLPCRSSYAGRRANRHCK